MSPITYLRKFITVNSFFSELCGKSDQLLLSEKKLTLSKTKALLSRTNPFFTKTTSKYPKPYPMNSLKPVLVLVALAIAGISFTNFGNPEPEPAPTQNLLQLPTEDFSPTKRNGKFADAERLNDVYTQAEWSAIGFPEITNDLALALKHHRHVLKKGKFRDGKKIGNLNVRAADFEAVIDLLIDREGSQPNDLHQYLEAHQVWGSDKKGHVRFTGYYTPVLKAKNSPSGKYRHPIYAKPKGWEGRLPSRREIEAEGHLNGLGLELGYSNNPVDISIMQLQGSGYVDFVDSGNRRLFRYAGHNGHRRRNIQRFFTNSDDFKLRDLSFKGIKRFLKKNPSLTDSVLHYNPNYTFFESTKGLVKGSGDVPLMKAISIAADPTYFPAGSVLLASFPIFEEGKITHHEYRILLPQDVGAAIKGPGHVDVYCGVGTAGEKMSANLHHYGKMWLLKPKEVKQIAEAI